MTIKKKNPEPKKEELKKKMEASNSKTKSEHSKQTIRKKRNEFGDNDAI